MEHRWGERIAVERTVRLTARPLAMGVGTLCNLSLSGAWISTGLTLVPGALVQLSLGHDVPEREADTGVQACVVRCDGLGIGVEWCELAPDAVLQWLQGASGEPLIAKPAAADAPAEELPARSVGA